jgi:hypothetical protein
MTAALSLKQSIIGYSTILLSRPIALSYTLSFALYKCMYITILTLTSILLAHFTHYAHCADFVCERKYVMTSTALYRVLPPFKMKTG